MSSNDDNDNEDVNPSSSTNSNVKFFELEDAFEDDGENVVGTKFFGGSTQKEELYVPEEEERALELQNVKSLEKTEREVEYRRFEDPNAFGDDVARRVGEALQSAINRILYEDDDDVTSWKEDSSLQWETPFSKTNPSPLVELAESKSFYNKLDVAILSAHTVQSSNDSSVVEVRWDVGVVWPNPWESRVLLTGTSVLTVRDEGDTIVLLKQSDRLDRKDGKDIVGSLSPQLSPRFWDVYHIGMSPSSELDPRFDEAPPTTANKSLSKSNNNKGKKGLLSGYKLSYLPPRLVTEPSLVDTNGRVGRAAQALPNHGFTTAIKTMGPNKESFTPVTPVEIVISKDAESDGSIVKWTVPVPPEFASKAVLPLPIVEDDDDETEGDDPASMVIATAKNKDTPSTTRFTPPPARSNSPPPDAPKSLACGYSLRPTRLVATLPYAGNPQDEEVTALRRKLYQDVVENDGFVPKLDPETGRPVFFFWMNDAKACFTRKGGLGMAVYEWRAGWSESNEVGIELEC